MDIRTKKLLNKKCIRCILVLDGLKVGEEAFSFIDFMSGCIPDNALVPFDEETITHFDKCMRALPLQNRAYWRTFKKQMQAQIDSFEAQAPVDLSAAYCTFTADDVFNF